MQAFKDSSGRTWEIVINGATIARVLGITKVNIWYLLDDSAKGLSDLLSNPPVFTNVIYLLSKQSEKVAEEELLAAMDGDTLEAAMNAFKEEFLFFSPKSKRETIRLFFDKGSQCQTLLLSEANKQLKSLDVSKLVEKLSGSTGNSPGKSESTPSPAPSAS